MDNNKLNAILRKLNAYRKDPDLVREPTLDEMATLIFFFLDQVKGFETSIKRGDLNGKTPEAGKDYPSKEQMLTELTKMVNSELTRLTKENDKQAKQITNALKSIRQPKDGKDGVVTEREIERAAEMAAVLIDLPDFDAMLAEAIQTDGATIRDALESLPEGEEQLSIEAIRGLRQELTDLAGKVGKETLGQFIGGGAAEKRIIQLIAEYSDSLPSQTGNSGKFLTTDGTDASWATLAGGGDMAAATYDPAGKSEQLLGISDILDEDTMTSNSATKVPSQQSVKAYVDANAGGASAIDDLTDVTITTPADNEVLAYDTTSSKFINQTPTEAGLQGVLAEGAFVDGDKTKLNGIEASADVTDTTNVTAAGALMDSEVTNLAAVKAFDPTDYATAAQGSTADSALQDITGESVGSLSDVTLTTPGVDELLFTQDGSTWINQTLAEAGIQGVLSEGAFVDGDKTKLDGIEASADVTDTANVTSAGALMDSELTDIAAVKALADAASTDVDTGTSTTMFVTPDALQASKRNIRWLTFNLVEAGTAVTTGTNIGGDFVSPIAGVIQQSDTTPFYLYATNSTAGTHTTTGTVVDINIDGTSIMTTNKLSFDSTEKTTTTATTKPDLTTTALAVGDKITIDVDSVADGTAPNGLTVYIGVLES